MVNSNSLYGCKPDSSLGKKYANSDTRGRFSNPFVSPSSLSAKMAYNLHHLHMLFCNCREEINLNDSPWFLPIITLLYPK
jgi:hypothetical protein